MKKNGFTLAEVLITLTIIGVIAAITIPNLMQNWRKHERITQIKTAYSLLQNAVKMAIAENGSPDSWDFGDGTDIAEKYILPYMKVQHVCGQAGNGTAKRNDCFIENGWYYINGNSAAGTGSGYGASWFYNVKLQNGMDFGIWCIAADRMKLFRFNVILFIFDVNGKQGPSKAGDDVFAFGMDVNDGKVRTLGLQGGHMSREWIDNTTNINTLLTSNSAYACNANSSGQWPGYSCARVLELNHWEFPDDYPIKKF